MNTGPTIFVIFGVTGDLSQKKLLPALFNLFCKGMLPSSFKIVGFSRRNWNHNDLKTFVESVLKSPDTKKVKAFLEKIEYAEGEFNDSESYKKLQQQLSVIDNSFGICSNKLLYLAVAPHFYETIFKELKKSGLSIPCGGDLGWTRILVEKPFGKDTETAAKLEKELSKIFKEPQIFRIDHYLAKETVQNILAFRFSNSMFEKLWNAESIERVEITLKEKNTVSERGDFYDGVGALRDVGQNHILQMLALIAMERPKDMSADEIRKKRSQVLQKLQVHKKGMFPTIRGQYQGFTLEKGVKESSQTETYFKLPIHIATSRWKGVPFILESGKALDSSETQIVIYFKQLPGAEQNILRFRIQPREGIEIMFWVKKPGFEREYQSTILHFSYEKEELVKEIPDAYERVLFDCVRGDQTLFASTSEVKHSWEFITPILKQWQKLPLMIYSKGSHGPLIS